LTVLLIDDDEDDRNFFYDAVNEISSSIECATVSNANDALKGLKSMSYTRPDIIFLDLNMPGMGGFECLKELKQDHSLMDIPVVMYSTSSSNADIKKALKLGAENFVTKPTSCDQLEKALTFLLRSFDLSDK
jgi:CheY-like chemotaxis protein